MTLMARLMLQCALDAQWVGDLFEQEDVRGAVQLRESLFSTTVEVMSTLSARLRRPASEAARVPHEWPASITVLHDRISRTRSGWGRALVRDSAQRLCALAQAPQRSLPATVQGYRLRVLHGSHLPAGVKCAPGPDGCAPVVTPLNALRGAALAAQSLIVYDPDLAMIVDLVPCERDDAHERALTGSLLDSVQPGELWIVDRRFSTRAILNGWPRRGSAFIVQEHGCTPEHRELDSPVEHGRIESGVVYEQSVSIADELGTPIVFRRIEVRLDRSSEGGERLIRILTNVPATQLDAQEVARLSCRHWSATLPVPLEPVFNGEMLSAGPPRAALLTFGVAAFAYNVLSTIVRVVSAQQELSEREFERLPSHVAAGVSATYAGMMVALPDDQWQRYERMAPKQLGELVDAIAAHVDTRSTRKQQREAKVSPVTAQMMCAATIDLLLGCERKIDLDTEPLAEQRAVAMATRDFSSNPSKALRDAVEAPVMVTKYGQAIAFLISVEEWNRMKAEIRESSLDRLAMGYAGVAREVLEPPPLKTSVN
ncbi:type II toxin-antitoxin system Phd/YefM family antitoxin [Paraburkholderia humisilvae]|uniref:Antitoxin n=1 Tax=Paraburkholderia humisilvae TaxID=627669 RepID=A0A6J5D5M3_9BURK|nr:type II toxin-antitoxin system Phd/YefM family antitoxin [Paraburkholderia humisilvae]CAB3749203.1 hypothetical protein LMG29542_00924 [Paraburkholderia humisilvae]